MDTAASGQGELKAVARLRQPREETSMEYWLDSGASALFPGFSKFLDP